MPKGSKKIKPRGNRVKQGKAFHHDGRTDAALETVRADCGVPPVESAQEQLPRIGSLDDVLALLLLLEPGDAIELARARATLDDFVAGNSFAEPALDLLTQASDLIGALVLGKPSDPNAALTEAGRLIAEARRLEAFPGEQLETAAPAPPQDRSAPESTDSSQAELLPPDSDPDLLREYFAESQDLISGAEAALLSLEIDPDDMEGVNSVFRAFHTIKGTSGFLGLTRVVELAHRAESLLRRVRDREIQCTGIYADLTLRSIDVLKKLMHSVRDALAGKPMTRPEGFDALLKELENPELARSDDSTQVPRLGDILVAEEKATRMSVEAVVAQKGADPIGIALVKSEAASLTDVVKALRTQRKIAAAESMLELSLRVRTDRLDRLIDLVGELVIAQSMVAQDDTVHHVSHHELLKKVTHAGKIARELQDLTMSMRMVPLTSAFQKMARLARDLAHKNNRLVSFVSEGQDTEIDRSMVDIISDPLVHMVRNAIDHGIETPDKRVAAGKPATGMLRLSAYHSGGEVVVELQDDGKGLDRAKILEKAIAKGLINPDRSLSDSEVFDLIFVPGFSTADRITDISGMGVGMDVVKRSVEALRGRIEIASKVGKGCTFTVRLPLTLAITDGMLIKVGAERYIIPTVNIHLSFRPDSSSLSTVAGRGEMVMLRGELMPIFRLHRLFGVAGAVENPVQGLLVVVGDGNRRCALLVDDLLGQQQVVAKALGDSLGKVQGISGGAILGDGRVGLILDPSEIVALARHSASGNVIESQTAA